ncbi:unnamed protein product [Caenorhabditis angaria]|uniref:MIT domain-containing protein n=1 Tax=Caenorhabditis angaria TaxID=860376 RepID=A0A9P1IGI9_9PELO|nr:unnamed protein product [Caenorhabditis angaria]
MACFLLFQKKKTRSLRIFDGDEMSEDKAGKLINSAKPLLIKAIDYEKVGKINDALPKYMEGISLLIESMSLMNNDDPRKEKLRPQLDSYLSRAEELKTECKIEVKFLEQRKIRADEVGHGYDKIFLKCCDEKLKNVRVEDAYIIAHHQILNFVRFCELIVQSSKNLRVISLKTGEDARSNVHAFNDLRASLEQHKVTLHVEYSGTIHDRQITFDNGWVVKIGRGLDYFKPPPKGKQYVLGACDMNLRPCHETTIDIFKSKK